MARETQPGSASKSILTDPFSVVLTSCGRFDLLAPTISSLLAHLEEAPQKFIDIEDSGSNEIRRVLEPLEDALGGPFEVIVNETQLGQMRAIDRAYARVETPLAFHCEDDWEFFRSGFLAESRRILAMRPDVSMVGLRELATLNPLVRETPVSMLEDDREPPVRYHAFDPKAHPEYFSYSFNPGLRRMDDLLPFLPLAEVGREEDVSYRFKRAGFRMATLAEPAVRHLGDDAHVNDPTSRPKPRHIGERLARSARKRVKRLWRAFE